MFKIIYKMKKKIFFAIDLIGSGKFKDVWQAFVRRIKSEEVAYGFKRDLNFKIVQPKTLLKIETRIYQPDDGRFFTERKNDGLINKFHTCYVGITKEGIPCCHLWLIDSSENLKLKNAWGKTFSALKKNEVLVENVYTVPKYRGMGIFPFLLDQMVDKSIDLGASYIISFGEASNINMSRSFVYAGFQPYIRRRKKWFLFIKSIKFEPISEEEMKDFNKYTKAYWAKPLEKSKTN
jgi:GNAT superfamily N-acetyltransferase